ncbi:hypothetical protein GN244_ATG01757 [Phytophthora infestans]|uniref:Uncharacterized protein n=1 Tax=Phytophthora infestans TaxID=4787 RepID=A0A833TA16_PHYIN|nr:hypothetical protein GN244_ATG01757 [Phytophthora infestans]
MSILRQLWTGVTDEYGSAMPTTDARNFSSVVEGANTTCNSGDALIVDTLYIIGSGRGMPSLAASPSRPCPVPPDRQLSEVDGS